MYGPPVQPPQPVNGLAAAFGASTDWQTSTGEDRHRRALYTRWRRNLPYPSMITFDVPERAVCSVRRVRTNTPLQALVTLNDPVYVEAAQALARRILTDRGTDAAARAAFGFRRCCRGRPHDAESQRLVALVRAGADALAAEPGTAPLLATKPLGPLPPEMDAARRRGLDGRRQRALEPRRNPHETLSDAMARSIHARSTTISRLASQTRRHFLRDGSLGLGGLALADRSLATGPRAAPDADPFAPRPPHFPAKVKNVIFLRMSGGPPHLDLFDYKPELVKRNGQDCPASLTRASGSPSPAARPSCWARRRSSPSTARAAPGCRRRCRELAEVADELTFIKSMYTDQFNHAPAELLLSPAFRARPGRPSLGSWVTYGLGSENRDLPGFIVFVSGGSLPSAGKSGWGSGFLPSVYQGVQCRTGGDPVLYLSDPEGMDRALRRLSLDALQRPERDAGQTSWATPRRPRGSPSTSWRSACRSVVPEVMDISREPPSVLEEYGAEPGAASFANNCLLARRLVEKGVRFVQLFDWGWDFHGTKAEEDIGDNLVRRCAAMDRPVAALITRPEAPRAARRDAGDLDGRVRPHAVPRGPHGRRPAPRPRPSPVLHTMFMAGGGLKPGFTFGATDELGFHVVEDPVHVHDLQATILHLLGFDHTKLTYRFQGRDYRLTDVSGRVVKEILA